MSTVILSAVTRGSGNAKDQFNESSELDEI